jgi:hypothetical protein
MGRESSRAKASAGLSQSSVLRVVVEFGAHSGEVLGGVVGQVAALGKYW